MRTRGVFGAAALLTAAFAWTACVGDDAGVASSSTDGAQNSKCFANGSCLVGLTCVNDVCVVVIDGGASSSSGFGAPSGDAGTAAERDTCGSIADGDGPQCPHGARDENCSLGQVCCPGTGCGTGACATSYAFECFADDHCKGNANGAKCCVHAPTGSPPGGVECLPKFLAPTAGSKCQQGCAADEVELCSPATFNGGTNTCASGTCTGTGILVPDNNGIYVKSVGLCE